MKHFFLLSLISLSLSAFAAIDEVWGPTSHPDIMAEGQERNFYAFPLRATVIDGQKFWSGDYWANNRGNINIRWNSNYQKGWNLRSPSPMEARSMSMEELSTLSPTEKYDIWVGRYDYPIKALVYAEAANGKAEDWEGICHGWAPATMNHHEPTPKTMTSVDGINVPFGSSDIKALLSYYYAFGFQVENTHQTGSRCFGGGLFSSRRKCPRDLNAGAFHIILGNRIGLMGVGFIADIDKSDEVWNHPIKSYSSEVVDRKKPKRNSAYGTASIVRVKTVMTYVDESNGNFWTPLLGTQEQVEKTKKYEYDLDLSASGEILGGEWKSGDRPDFLWIKEKPAAFEGYFARLGELLND